MNRDVDLGCVWKSSSIVTQGALQRRLASLKQDTCALYLVSKDPRVPRLAKIIVAVVVAYALSPIDLIPDFIPVLGYLDDLILLPLGVWLAIRLTPPEVWRECRARAADEALKPPPNRRAAKIIVFLWIIGLVAATVWIWRVIGVAEPA